MRARPSYKAGIRPGDVIVAVDGKSTEGMDSAAVASLLKGPRGTHVSVTMAREGSAKPLVFDLVRDEIPRPSVDLAFMIRPGVGYIHVTNFMETTSREVGDALDKFGDINGLVIDLRGNPGGLLNEAVDMADKFLAEGTDRRLAARPRLPRPGLSRRPWRRGQEVSHRRSGQPQHGLGRRDRLRRAAGSRPRPDRRRNHLRQGPGPDRLPDSARTPASR